MHLLSWKRTQWRQLTRNENLIKLKHILNRGVVIDVIYKEKNESYHFHTIATLWCYQRLCLL